MFLEAHDLELVIEVLLRVRIGLHLAGLALLDNTVTDFADHLHYDVTNSDSCFIVADQLVDEGMACWSVRAIGVGSVGPVSGVQFFRAEGFKLADFSTGFLFGDHLKDSTVQFFPELSLIDVFLIFERSLDINHLNISLLIVLLLAISFGLRNHHFLLRFLIIPLNIFFRVVIDLIDHGVNLIRFFNGTFEFVVEILGDEAEEGQHHYGENQENGDCTPYVHLYLYTENRCIPHHSYPLCLQDATKGSKRCKHQNTIFSILFPLCQLIYFFICMTSIRRSLTQYLLKWNNFELLAERIREKIAENPYFQMETVFERFDKFKKGYLIPDDFSEFMLENRIYPTEIELYLIFRDFDKDRVGVVTLQRLIQELLPKENGKLNKKALDRKYYQGGIKLEIDLEYIISRYFDHKIKEIKQLSRIRAEMNQRQSFVVQEGFGLLDNEKKGVISSLASIDSFLRNNGKVVAKDDLVRLYRLITFDSEGPVLYDTFSEHLDPLGKGYYIGYSQRIAQKSAIQQDYLRQKYELSKQTMRNSRQKVILHQTIEELHASNNKLSGILREQQIQQRLKEDQLLQYRRRRHLY